MSKLTKRITAMLLAGMLVIGSVPGSVLAASTDVDPGQTSEIAQEVYKEESSEAPAGEGETAEIEETSEAPAGVGETAEREETSEVPMGAGETAESAEEVSAEDTSETPAAAEESLSEAASAEEAQYYTVTLDANGGYFENEWDDAIGDYTQQAEVVEKHIHVDGTVASFPVFSDQDGQTMLFAGWSLERDGELITTGDEVYSPVDNCTLYAAWQAVEPEDAALGETGEQEVADEVTEQADAAQEMEGIDAAAGDTVTAEGSAAEEDTAAEANTDPETENEQDIVSDQQELYVDEGTENISEDSSDAVVSEEGAQPELNESSQEEEETVREDAANGEVASGTCGDNLTWTLDEEGTLTISGTGEEYSFIYADASPWYTLRLKIKKGVISNGVTAVGNEAFDGCENLTSVEIANSVTTIGEGAFYKCTSLGEISIPNSVTGIEQNAFYGCSQLSNIEITDSVVKIGGFAFQGTPWLNAMGELAIFNHILLRYTGSSTSFTVPDGIKMIGAHAFNRSSGLQTVTIPDGVEEIWEFAFSGCNKLTEVELPEGVTCIEQWAFASCSGMTKIKLPNSLISIGGFAFYNCTNLSNVSIPKNVKKIDTYAFSNCTSFTDIAIPKGIQSLSWGLFDGCSNLASVIIPKSVTEIKNWALNDCSSLKDIYYEGSEEEWGKLTIGSLNNDPLSSATVHCNYGFGGNIELEPEISCVAGVEITVSATYKGSGTITSVNVKPDNESAMEIGEVSIGAPVGTGDDAETLISFPLKAKKAGEYNLTLTADDGTKASTVVKAKGLEITLEDQTIYDDDETYIIKADIRSPQAPTADDLTWTLTRNNISYKNSIKEVIIETDEKDSALYHIKQSISLIHWGVYSVSLTYGGKKKEADLTMLHGKPLVSKVKSGKHRELVIDWNYGLCGMASGYRIKFADNRELKNAVVYEMGASPCDNSSGKIQMIDGDEDSFLRFTSKKPMKRGAKLYVRLCCMADKKEGKWSDLTEVQIGKQILSEEFFGMANTDVGVNDLVSTDLKFLKNVFDEGTAKLIYDFKIAEEKAAGVGDGSSISLGKGICYGMDVAALAACSYGFPSDLYGRDSLYEIDSFTAARKAKGSGTNISAEDMIRYGYFLQYADCLNGFEDSYWSSADPLLDLVNRVKACEKGTETPPLIAILDENQTKEGVDWASEDDKGHAVVGICISDDNEDETIVEVYNPCYPGKHTEDDEPEKKQYYSLHIRKKNGEYTGWSFQNNSESLYEGELSSRVDFLNDDCLFAIDTSLHTEALKKISRGVIPFHGEQKTVSWNYLHDVDHERTFNFTDYQYRRLVEEQSLSKEHILDELADGSNHTSSNQLWHTTLDEIPLCFYGEGDNAGMAQGQYYLRAIAGGKTDCTISQSSEHPGYVSFTPEEDALQTAIFSGRMNEINEIEQTVVQVRIPVGRTGSIHENEDGTFTVEGVTSFDWKRYSGTMQGDNTIDDQAPDTVALDNLDPDSTYSISANEDAIIVNEDKDNDGNIDDTVSEIPLRNLIASGECGENLTWSLDEAGVLFISGTGSMANYFNQGTSPFSSYEVKKVRIKKGVTSIGNRAFEGQSSLTSVQIPESVNRIGDRAFSGCTALEELDWIKAPRPTRIGDEVFLDCDSLSSVVIPEGVSTLGDYAFARCNQLKSVIIPDTVFYIGDYVFTENDSLENVQMSTKAQWKAVLVGIDGVGGGFTYPEGLFSNCPSLKTMTIPEGHKNVFTSEFENCESLQSITLPKTLKKIKDNAFKNCGNLATVIYNGTREEWKALNIDSGNNALERCKVECSDGSLMLVTALSVTLPSSAFTYTGKAITPEVMLKDGSITLKKGTDYEVSYTDNTNIGTATVTITGKGNYTGTVSKTFTISAASIANATVSGIFNKTYTGSALTQNPTVKVGDKTLKKGTDYTISYQNNLNVGTATVTITGKGNYASKKTVTFKINKAAQSITAKAGASRVAVGKTTTVSITGNKGTKSYKSSNTAIATVTSAGKVTAKKVGTVKITATSAATSNYNAVSKTITIKVVPAATASLTAANQATGFKLTWNKVTGANGYKVYRGSTLIKTITSGSTVTFADTAANTNGTKYTYKVVAKATTGDSTLSKSVAVYRVARPAISSVTNSAASKMTVKWGKNAKANGYQIQYSLSSSFASGNKAVIISSASTVSRVIGSLTKGKTYYVRIRTYKTVGSTKYWSEWSAKKSVKISK